MQINEETFVSFDRLVPANRSFGSIEAIKLPSERAAVPNTEDGFAPKTLQEIHISAKTAATNLHKILTA